MEDFKPNSYKSKEPCATKESTPTRKLEAVVSGKSEKKKKTETKKFLEAFIKDDIGNIGLYILNDVIVPSIKRTILDSVKAILGDTSVSSRGNTVASKVSYRSYYDEKESSSKTQYASTGKSGCEYDDIMFERRVDAEAVLDAMLDIVNSQYAMVSVADLYDLAGVTTENWTINKYGWTSLYGARVVGTTGGYMIKLPRAIPLK